MILNDDDLRKLGYVCTECGRVNNRLKACASGCTKVCPSCLNKKGHSFIFCQKCGNMTLATYKGRGD